MAVGYPPRSGPMGGFVPPGYYDPNADDDSPATGTSDLALARYAAMTRRGSGDIPAGSPTLVNGQRPAYDDYANPYGTNWDNPPAFGGNRDNYPAEDWATGRADDMRRRLEEIWSGRSGGAQPGSGRDDWRLPPQTFGDQIRSQGYGSGGYGDVQEPNGYGLGLGRGFRTPDGAPNQLSYNQPAATTGYGFGADQGGFDQSAVDAALAGFHGGGFIAPAPVQAGGGDRGASWDAYQTGDMIPGIGIKGLGGAVGIKQEALDDGYFHDSAADHGGNADRSDSMNN